MRVEQELETFELCPCIVVDKGELKETNDLSPAKKPDNTHQQTFLSKTPRPLLPGLFSASDSVSSFMEAHGKERLMDDSKRPNAMLYGPPHCHKTKADHRLQTIGSPIPPETDLYTISLDELPPSSDTQQQTVLFLAKELLKTHGSLVHKLETLTNPPTLMFQELSTSDTYVDKRLSLRDADITLSPRVGMLLVTPMDFMQLHLPGHSILLKSGTILNSPFQERIYRICEKYDELYIFTLHSANPTTIHSQVTVKQKTYNAMTSIRAFCNSMDIFSKVKVLDVSSDVTILSRWIVNLGRRHQSLLLPGDLEGIVGRPYSLPPQCYICPADPEPISNALDEQFLTQCLLLNYFAAAFVLHMLSPILAQAQGTDQGLLAVATWPGEESVPILVTESLLAGLRELFDGKSEGKPYVKFLLGERAFSRAQDRTRCIVLRPFMPNPQSNYSV